MPMLNPVHPGQILRAYMGEELGVSALAKHLGVTRANLSMILNGRAGISAAMAMKLSEAFSMTTPDLWLRLQNIYDLAQVRKLKRVKIRPIRIVASRQIPEESGRGSRQGTASKTGTKVAA